jgi:mannosyl-3-phosphoglycerate phosphatase
LISNGKFEKENDLWIIFTDLDGTLLDEQNYSFSEAIDAINFLKDHNYPIIPCTSKTHQEVIALRSEMGLTDPFIVENGSAVFSPKNFFELDIGEQNLATGYHHKTLGKNYKDILKFFNHLVSTFALEAKGFSQMSIEEIQALTGLREKGAILAKKRSFSEPFIITSTISNFNEIEIFARNHGYRILMGNRFYHLLGHSDKGNASNFLINLYCKNIPEKKIRSIGIGDSMNDLEMLKVVDIPVLVSKSSGHHQGGIDLPNLIKTNKPGPTGWQEAIFKILRKN